MIEIRGAVMDLDDESWRLIVFKDGKCIGGRAVSNPKAARVLNYLAKLSPPTVLDGRCFVELLYPSRKSK